VTARPIGAAVLLAACLAACGEDQKRKLDTAPIERGIARGIERDRPGTKVVSVTCPEDVELEKGGRFSCRVRGSKPGEEAIARVTQVDAGGRVRYRVP
jgi:hypothetical protein